MGQSQGRSSQGGTNNGLVAQAQRGAQGSSKRSVGQTERSMGVTQGGVGQGGREDPRSQSVGGNGRSSQRSMSQGGGEDPGGQSVGGDGRSGQGVSVGNGRSGGGQGQSWSSQSSQVSWSGSSTGQAESGEHELQMDEISKKKKTSQSRTCKGPSEPLTYLNILSFVDLVTRTQS